MLHPGADDAFAQADDNALVLARDVAGTRVLLLSDLGRAGEAALLAREADLRADVVVTGLPVKGQPLSDELLEAMQPRLIVVADDDRPATALAPRALRERLAAGGWPVVYTSEVGAVWFRSRVGLGRLNHQVEMIRHQAVCVDLPAGFENRLGQRFQQALPVRVVSEDGFASVASIHDVVDRAGVLDSQLAGHGGGLARARRRHQPGSLP
ncbi:MAG: hypothetical protein M5U12_10605 [Verrucomicrobia bacterium]|nr:hypothetical protein [Verrucomicrobiota bacterium]